MGEGCEIGRDAASVLLDLCAAVSRLPQRELEEFYRLGKIDNKTLKNLRGLKDRSLEDEEGFEKRSTRVGSKVSDVIRGWIGLAGRSDNNELRLIVEGPELLRFTKRQGGHEQDPGTGQCGYRRQASASSSKDKPGAKRPQSEGNQNTAEVSGEDSGGDRPPNDIDVKVKQSISDSERDQDATPRSPIADLQLKYEALETRYFKTETELNSERIMRNAEGQRIEAIESAKVSLQQDHDSLQMDFRRLKDEYDKLQSDYDSLQAESDDLAAENGRQKEEIDRLNADNAKYRELAERNREAQIPLVALSKAVSEGTDRSAQRLRQVFDPLYDDLNSVMTTMRREIERYTGELKTRIDSALLSTAGEMAKKRIRTDREKEELQQTLRHELGGERKERILGLARSNELELRGLLSRNSTLGSCEKCKRTGRIALGLLDGLEPFPSQIVHGLDSSTADAISAVLCDDSDAKRVIDLLLRDGQVERLEDSAQSSYFRIEGEGEGPYRIKEPGWTLDGDLVLPAILTPKGTQAVGDESGAPLTSSESPSVQASPELLAPLAEVLHASAAESHTHCTEEAPTVDPSSPTP